MLPDQRQYLERSLAFDASKAFQSHADHTEWANSGYTFRVLCHYDKIFAVWRHTASGPVILGGIRVRNPELTTGDGLGLCLESEIGGTQSSLWIGHSPRRLFGLPVFAHIPFMAEVSYIPEASRPDVHIVRVPVVFKTPSNPKTLVEQDIYVTQIGEFRAMFQQFENLKL